MEHENKNHLYEPIPLPPEARVPQELQDRILATASEIYPTIKTGWGEYRHEDASFHLSCGIISEKLHDALIVQGIDTEVVTRGLSNWEPYELDDNYYTSYDESHVFLSMPYGEGTVVIDPTWLQFAKKDTTGSGEGVDPNSIEPVLVFYYETEEDARKAISGIPGAPVKALMGHYLGYDVDEYKQDIATGKLIVKSAISAEWRYPDPEEEQNTA